MSAKIFISKQELEQLYYVEKKSKYKIGDIYNCSFKTVLNRMREYGMEPLSRSVIQSKYSKTDFTGDYSFKAYLIGFRIGDLNVYKTTDKSEVVIVRCHTTVREQVVLMEELFSEFGKVSISYNKKSNSYHVNCFLNSSFNFLLPKGDYVEKWIKADNRLFAAFLAGYSDAEGNIGVYDGRARFKIDTYDNKIISLIYDWLIKNGIDCPIPMMIGAKNFVYNKEFGYKYNKDVWRIRVSKTESLRRLFELILPFSRHKLKIRDIKKCLKNLDDRRK